MSTEKDIAELYNTIHDDDLNDYINGNFIANIKKKGLESDEQDKLNMSIIIDYHINKYNIENSKENIKKYINMYNNIIYNNFVILANKHVIPFYKTEEGIEYDKVIKENDEYENDKRLHYQQYFGRYKDIDYIIEYYKKLIEDYETQEYNLDDNNSNISDEVSYTSDIDDYQYDDYDDEYYEDNELYDYDEYY
tara:strand:- start:7455 stop:8033 length:579 start_codon:yes stop_codon:yes gene_type:complete